MFRTAAARPLLRTVNKLSATRPTFNAATISSKATSNTSFKLLSSKRPQGLVSSPFRPVNPTLLRFATNKADDADPNKVGNIYDKIDTKAEEEVAKHKLPVDPEHVSLGSSTRHVFEGSQSAKKDSEDMLAGIRADLVTVKDTFKLGSVPRESYFLGMAGVLPYLATSVSTFFLAYDINYANHHNGMGMIFSPETAHQILSIIEPVQVGYGAVIISFLGAIHWGLEYAGFGGYHSYRRYMIGVAAPAIAWPTMLMPVEQALITQFLAFVLLYFADTRAATKGWAPAWYGPYRFVLTFVVGASIVISLIGRGKVISGIGSLPGPAEGMQEFRDQQWENLEKEEKDRQRMVKEAEEEASDDAHGGDSEEESGDGEKKDDKEKDDE